MTVSTEATTRVKVADSTKACEIPAGHPFSDWSDADFAAYEARLEALYGLSARDEAEADRWARANDDPSLPEPAHSFLRDGRQFHDPPAF